MKDMFLTLVAGIVSINLIVAVNNLNTITNKLNIENHIEMLQNPNHAHDNIICEIEAQFSDEEMIEILGL